MSDRFHVKFSPPARALMNELAASMGTTHAGALVWSMNVAAKFLAEQRRGNTIGVVKGDRAVKEFLPPWPEPRPAA